MRFDNKVAIVTGGAGAIGFATTILLAREGARVLMVDKGEAGEQLAKQLRSQGLEVVFHGADVTDEPAVAGMVDTATNLWGRLDIMVANAGITGLGNAETCDLAAWQQVMAVNVSGVFLCTKYAAPAMKRCGGGAIVNTASIMGLVSTAGAMSYCASKGAVVNMTRAAALDYAADNIRINAVCPGHLVTAVTGNDNNIRDPSLTEKYPLGRLCRAEEVANAIAFLASPEASFITGVALAVDGGYSAR